MTEFETLNDFETGLRYIIFWKVKSDSAPVLIYCTSFVMHTIGNLMNGFNVYFSL